MARRSGRFDGAGARSRDGFGATFTREYAIVDVHLRCEFGIGELVWRCAPALRLEADYAEIRPVPGALELPR